MSTVKTTVLALATTTLLTATAGTVEARDTSWRTYAHNGSCFAVAYPTEDAIRAVQPRKAYLSIRHLPSEDAWDAVAVVSGMGDVTGAKASITVDGETFPLLVYGEAGYVSGAVEDALVAAMGRSTEAKVRWVDEDRMASHTFSLVGFTAARDEIDRTCVRPVAPPAETAAAG